MRHKQNDRMVNWWGRANRLSLSAHGQGGNMTEGCEGEQRKSEGCTRSSKWGIKRGPPAVSWIIKNSAIVFETSIHYIFPRLYVSIYVSPEGVLQSERASTDRCFDDTAKHPRATPKSLWGLCSQCECTSLPPLCVKPRMNVSLRIVTVRWKNPLLIETHMNKSWRALLWTPRPCSLTEVVQ